MYEIYYRVSYLSGSQTETLETKEAVLAFVADLLKGGIELIQIRWNEYDNL